MGKRPKIVELVPGERVKIFIDGACLTGEVVRRSVHNKNEWVVRTYYHDMLTIVDNIHIISARREKFYQKALKPGTVVEVVDRKAKRVGVIVDSIIKNIDEDVFIYIPIVLIGTDRKLCAPETLRVLRCDRMKDICTNITSLSRH